VNNGFARVATTIDPYTVREADLGRDRDLIIDLWSRNLAAHTAAQHRARFDWHYGNHPMPGRRCFLAYHTATERVIGTSGLGVRRVFSEDGEVTAGIAIDFAVERDHRTLQPAMFLARAVTDTIAADVEFIYALPNASARAVFRRAGYAEVGPFRRFVKVLDARQFLSRRNMTRGVAGIAGAGVNFGLRAIEGFRGGYWNECRAEEMDWSDDRIARLWASARKRHIVMGDRRAPHLKWRFGACPLHRHILMGLTRGADKDVLGYAVVYHAEDGQIKVPDFLLVSDHWAVKAWMALSRWGQKRNASSIAFESVRPTEASVAALRQAGFYERESSEVLYILDKRPRSPAVRTPWYFLRGDEFYNTF
jgi:hypothetical protein